MPSVFFIKKKIGGSDVEIKEIKKKIESKNPIQIQQRFKSKSELKVTFWMFKSDAGLIK